jgi:hypothetical protein
MNTDSIDAVKRAGKFRGKKEMLACLQGRPLSRAQAMAAMCFDCMGYFDNGAEDCEVQDCPLYGYMPYKVKKRPKSTKPRTEAQQRASERLTQQNREKQASRV